MAGAWLQQNQGTLGVPGSGTYQDQGTVGTGGAISTLSLPELRMVTLFLLGDCIL